MNASTLTTTELVAQWLPRLRRIAFETGADLDDIKQQAWILATTMKSGDDLVPRWLQAVERHALDQAPGKNIRPGEKKNKEFIGTGWLAGSGADDPSAIHEAVESVAELLSGHRLDQVIGMPKNARELAQTLGKSERQARRDLRRLEQFSKMQGDLFVEVMV